MKWHDALRNDAEMRDDLAQFLDGERDLILADFERASSTDMAELTSCKHRLDALQRLRFLLTKGLP